MSVAGVVVDPEGRVLAVRRRDNGRWEVPGGVLELGESFAEGVRREIAEETGVDVVVGPVSGVYKNMVRGVVALVFRCELRSGVPRPTDEAAEVRWLSREEVCALMVPAFAIRVFDAFEGALPSGSMTGTTCSRGECCHGNVMWR
ncbi:NUDIX hydrolase [Actinokineospora soli]|uniref:NUDIX hydrolase n=1 Tax=Actinokineospora soli TaxID=1048753 RepID=A0ABW2TGL6_9PSEU